MKTINTVVGDVYSMMESKEYTGDLQKIADRVGKEVSDALVESFAERQKSDGLRM